MKIAFTPESWKDYLFWQTHDKKILTRINELIKNILHSPFSGIGKPEPLRYELKGCWSRRITQEHRLIYYLEEDILAIIAARFYYGN